jgi:membrane fusion protein (multidrug efflux system)
MIKYSLFYIKMSILMVLILYSCGDKRGEAKTNMPAEYPVLTLQPHPITTYDDFPATIQGEDIVEIRPMVDGYLEEIYVDEGATVAKGQLLFKIKNPQFEQDVNTTEAAIQIAIADVNTAKMDVEKVRPLVEKGIVSKYELESAQYTLQSKESALAEANAALANAKTNMGYTILRSPQDGVIGSIPYKMGALVSSTTSSPLTILSNIKNVFAYFSWNEKQLLSFSGKYTGNTLQDRLNQLPPVTLLLADGSVYNEKGKLETASGLINTETGSVSIKAIFPNPKGVILSGSSGIVRLTNTVDSALLLPQSASYEIQDKHFVYTLTANNKVASRQIVSQPTNDGQFLLVQSGLKKGDRVVLNVYNLKDSTLVTPRIVNADSLYRKIRQD